MYYSAQRCKFTSRTTHIVHHTNDQSKTFCSQHLPLESPCSPIIHPWQLVGAIPSLCDIRNLNLLESRFVPLPSTRFLGSPLSFHATYVSISTGLLTISSKAFGEYFTSWGMIILKISVLRWTKSRRDSPSLWRAPAETMQRREPAVTE